MLGTILVGRRIRAAAQAVAEVAELSAAARRPARRRPPEVANWTSIRCSPPSPGCSPTDRKLRVSGTAALRPEWLRHIDWPVDRPALTRPARRAVGRRSLMHRLVLLHETPDRFHRATTDQPAWAPPASCETAGSSCGAACSITGRFWEAYLPIRRRGLARSGVLSFHTLPRSTTRISNGTVALAEGRVRPPGSSSPRRRLRRSSSRPRLAPSEWSWRGSAGGDRLRVDRDPGGHRLA